MGKYNILDFHLLMNLSTSANDTVYDWMRSSFCKLTIQLSDTDSAAEIVYSGFFFLHVHTNCNAPMF